MTGRNIAIIGSGISGLTCGYYLHKTHNIRLFEANGYIGGHTNTIEVRVPGDNTPYQIDTGFIVYNDWTYPRFTRLLDEIGIQGQQTQMSFSVTNPAENLEYNGYTLNTLFAQRRNLLRPRFWRFINELLRFNRLCKALDETTLAPTQSLQDLLSSHGFSAFFANNYILPMCAAIWSSSIKQSQGFPLRFFLRFFKHHGLLNLTNRPQWYSIVGGSSTYVPALTQGFAESIALNSPVLRVQRQGKQWALTLKDGQQQCFDEVIFACHSDQALAMLATPTAAQSEILGNIGYASNEVVVHTDTRLLPARKLAWASWNYHIQTHERAATTPPTLTYLMNTLQCLKAPHTFCVTLNNKGAIAADKVLASRVYYHPQIDANSLAAVARRAEICGIDKLHFCGAYWYNGFHEDGVRSALDVCERFGVAP